MHNFFHTHRYILGIFATLFIAVGIVRLPMPLFAETTNLSGTSNTSYAYPYATTYVTFSVTLTDEIDCGDPLRPKTKASFIVDPVLGGSFKVSSNVSTDSLSLGSGTHALPNGTYYWYAVVSPGYAGTGTLQGSFTLKDVQCPSTTEGALSGVTTTTTATPLAVTTTTTTATSTLTPVTVTTTSETSTKTTTATVVATTTQVADDSFLSPPKQVSTTTIAVPVPTVEKETPKPLPTTVLPPVPQTVTSTVSPTPTASEPITPFVIPFNTFGESTRKELVSIIPQKEQTEIAVKVKTPAACENIKECAVYCEQANVRKSGACVTFARTQIKEEVAPTPLPATSRPVPVKEERTVIVERVGARVFIDSDADGVNDYDEVNIYRTNPEIADSDKDGVSDGAELLARTNPMAKEMVLPVGATATSAGPATTTVPLAVASYEDVVVSKELTSNLLAVQEVVVSKVATSTEGKLVAKELTLKGKALPNSFVTLYIFSEPIVVTVKTDASGEWSYTLDRELPDGEHHVVSAITDSGGRILAKSEPLPFVKVAQAVTVGNVELALPSANQEPGFFSGVSLYAFMMIIAAALGLGFLSIGFMVRRSASESDILPR